MTTYDKIKCASCGNDYIGDPAASDTAPGLCPPCDATATSDDETFVCDKCDIDREVQALGEVHHGDDGNTHICVSCLNHPQHEPEDPTDPIEKWYHAIDFARQYGRADSLETPMLNTMTRSELESLALSLSALVHLRGTYHREIEDHDEWLRALRGHIVDWFDRN